MKILNCFTSGVLVLLASGCVEADSTYYVERPVPVSVAPPPPEPPMPPAAPVAQIQTPPPAAVPALAVSTAVATGSVATDSVLPLDRLVAPVALYPDPLLALILPGSTMSSDIVLAARYLAGGGDPQQVDAQPWDESVKGLAHYPELVKWLDDNLAWTQQLGAAYLESPDNVMAAVQRVRAEARAKGLLADTPQQQIVVQADTIAIEPAQADVIYVPRYDPEIIFVDRPVIYETDPWLTFGVGFGVGWWLSYDCDWYQRRVWVDRHSRDHWRDHPTWRQPHFVGGGGAARPPGWEPWRPAPGRPRPMRREVDHSPVFRPGPMPGTPHREIDRRHDQPGRPPGDNRRLHPSRPDNGSPAPAPAARPRVDRVAPPAGAPSSPRHDRDPNPSARDHSDTPGQPRPAVTPQERPRIRPAPIAPVERDPVAPRVAPPARTARPEPTAPAADRPASPAQPESRRVAPVEPRERRSEPRSEPRADRAPRTEPAPRVAPVTPARQENKADNANRSPSDNHDKTRDADR